jgi:hypothetical protein
MSEFGFADYTAAVPNVLGRWRYLQAVKQCVPDALRELVAVPVGEEKQLRAWAKYRGFEDEWALKIARDHISRWQILPEAAGKWLMIEGMHWEPVMPVFAAWNPFGETEKALRQRFERYIAQCKATPGLIRTPEKQTGDAHFEWLAMHHAGRLTYEQVEDCLAEKRQHPDRAEISRAINSTAALVGLTLRPRRGRKLSQVR